MSGFPAILPFNQVWLVFQKMVVVLVGFVVVQFVVNREDAIGACPFDLL
jgi:hypothetical protein